MNSSVRLAGCRCLHLMHTVPAIDIAHTASTLKPWEDAVSGLASFLDSWQKVGPEEARKRAKRYLTAMPAWAHKAEE